MPTAERFYACGCPWTGPPDVAPDACPECDDAEAGRYAEVIY